MYNVNPANTTNASLLAGTGVTLAQIWDYKCRHHGETPDYFADAETAEDSPSGANNLVTTKDVTSAGRGQKVNFRNSSGYYGEGKRAEALFTASTDFEQNTLMEYPAYVNVFRNATSANEFTTETNAYRDEIENGVPQKLGAWLDRLKTETIDVRVRDTSHSSSLFTANSKGVAGLLSSDVLDVNNMLTVSGYLSTLGGRPAVVAKGKETISKWVFGPTTEVVTTLQAQSDYQTLWRQSNTGIDYILKGEVATIGNQIVRPYNVINHDGNGAIGSARLPMGRLSVAIAAGTAALTVYFGGTPNATNDTTKLYSKHFLGYAYTWLTGVTGEVLTSNPIIGGTDFTTKKYLMIVNPPNPGGSYVANGVGYYEYTTGNNGNAITCTKRLSATGGVFGGTNTAVATFTTSGSITPTLVATYGATFAEDHPVDAMIYQCNVRGVPLGFTPVYGAGGILRPYGLHRLKRGMEMEEDGFMARTYLRSYFGTQLRKDNASRTPSVGCIAHAVKFPYHTLPNVTA